MLHPIEFAEGGYYGVLTPITTIVNGALAGKALILVIVKTFKSVVKIKGYRLDTATN